MSKSNSPVETPVKNSQPRSIDDLTPAEKAEYNTYLDAMEDEWRDSMKLLPVLPTHVDAYIDSQIDDAIAAKHEEVEAIDRFEREMAAQEATFWATHEDDGQREVR